MDYAGFNVLMPVIKLKFKLRVGLEDQCFLIYSYSNLIVEEGTERVVLTANL